ncbi:MAG: hypothetical protein D6808_01030, partial [Candidatus Dadabacteria bacterium]
MFVLELFFDDNEGLPALSRSCFTPCFGDTCGVTRVSLRGRTGSSQVGTFAWSSGVKALCSLFIKQKIFDLSQDEALPYPKLSGSRGSMAASLDYALSKEPQWLQDMFGITYDGTLIVKQIIERLNPERKAGPVVMIWLSPDFTEGSEINIYYSGKPVVDVLHLEQILEGIHISFSYSQSKGEECFFPPFSSDLTPDVLMAEFKREVTQALFRTRAFSSEAERKVILRLLQHPLFSSLVGSKREVFNSLTSYNPLSEWDANREHELIKALIDHNHSKKEGIQAAIAVGAVPSLLIFSYLKDILGLNLTVDYNYSSTQQL